MKHVGTADNKEGRNTTWDVGKHLSRNVQASNDSSEPIKNHRWNGGSMLGTVYKYNMRPCRGIYRIYLKNTGSKENKTLHNRCHALEDAKSSPNSRNSHDEKGKGRDERNERREAVLVWVHLTRLGSKENEKHERKTLFWRMPFNVMIRKCFGKRHRLVNRRKKKNEKRNQSGRAEGGTMQRKKEEP